MPGAVLILYKFTLLQFCHSLSQFMIQQLSIELKLCYIYLIQQLNVEIKLCYLHDSTVKYWNLCYIYMNVQQKLFYMFYIIQQLSVEL